jgi:hypothetical protein
MPFSSSPMASRIFASAALSRFICVWILLLAFIRVCAGVRVCVFERGGGSAYVNVCVCGWPEL